MNRSLTIKQFFNTSVREYSVYANQRAIPSIMDGFKPSQRKVIFGALKASIPETGIKVAQLAASVSLVSSYHHGEASLEGTIVGMAQDYSGANNLNYLAPLGQFGTRLSETASASRYIYTKLMPVFRKLFKKVDDRILNHLEDDGKPIEPEFYLPILPNVLINGTSGMGTGFATNILPYNPEHLQAYILNMFANDGGQLDPLVPWFRGFKGTVERTPEGGVMIKGKVEKESSTKLLVTELPIGTYLDTYKAHLLSLVDEGYIKDFENRSTADSFLFELTVPRTTSYEDEEALYKKLRLITKVKENFTVWLPHGKLKCFDTPEQIIEFFVKERLVHYQRRKDSELKRLEEASILADEKVRFIELYLKSSLEFSKLTKAKLEALLRSEGFTRIDELLNIRIYNLTKDKIDELLDEQRAIKREHKYYMSSTPESLYVTDLSELDLSSDLAKTE